MWKKIARKKKRRIIIIIRENFFVEEHMVAAAFTPNKLINNSPSTCLLVIFPDKSLRHKASYIHHEITPDVSHFCGVHDANPDF